MSAALRLFHTLRYLRPAQVGHRIGRNLRTPRVDLAPAPPVRAAAGRWHNCARRASLVGDAVFDLLGERHALAAAGDWNRGDVPRLWLYNLHYFDDLAATNASLREARHRALIARWIKENPPGAGAGWEPYPTSLRCVNWIKWMLAGHAAETALHDSLVVQVRWLRARLEKHLLGNHLWANAKALAFAGAFFTGGEADAWRGAGLDLLRRELREQVLPDGGHFERSPMYHAIVLEDILDLLQVARMLPQAIPEVDVHAWRLAAARMLRWLAVMSHPDGGIALFNDAAFAIAPNLAALEAYARKVGVAVASTSFGALEVLPESGYARLAAGPAVLIADVGEIGPDYLPGHAHADTLSFELSVAGRRMLVNGGTSTYAPGPERLRQRGTAAHNTVCIDGADSSEIWAAFRVARRARPRDVAWGVAGTACWLRAAHDGYARLRGKPVHRREWRLDEQRLVVEDRIQGRYMRAESRLHLHPAWRAQRVDELAGEFLAKRTPAGCARMAWHADGPVRIERGSWHPAFGVATGCEVLAVPLRHATGRIALSW